LGFGAGYYVGTNRLDELKRDILKLKNEMTDKAGRLEKELTNLRHRDNLIVAKDKLQDAQRALNDKNFGEAQKAIQDAQEKIREAQKLAGPSEKEKYNAISSGLNEISSDLAHSAQPQLREKLKRASKDLEQLAGE
jgi:hypothetical protein